MKKGKLLSLLLAAVVGAGSLAMTAQAAPAELPAQTAKTAAFVKASDWVLKDDWAIFALGRNQEEGCEKLYEDYYQGVLALLADPAKLIPSDYIRLSLSLTAIGIDPRNVEGNDLLEKIDQADREKYFQMPTSSLAYALALMERYPDSFSGTLKEDTIQKILGAQQADGSFDYTVGGGYPDPDSTAQAMQGLMLLGDTYASEIQAAVDWLKAQMNEDGAILNWGAANPSSTAQALIAFAQKGEVPANDQGKTLYDGIMTFALDNGSFQDANWQTGELEYNEYATGQCFQALDNGSFQDANWQTGELEYNEYATGQCFQALAAYSRMVNGQSALFDLSDAAVTPRPKPEEEKPESGSSSSQASSEPSGAPEEESEPPASSEAADLDSPKTGDMGLVSIAAVGLIAAAAAVVLYRKK